ncbi:hypothetical protein [Methylobacter sp.]|uniref:hypothetical protein n=1 Tax=Methylobacter sp. TaxID=2051955 RepID=UPI0024889EA4|nr:hypothetical protein [Methylobacter sp.]MDI1278062.1 hypothetical protein [Methylobacter sp.]
MTKLTPRANLTALALLSTGLASRILTAQAASCGFFVPSLHALHYVGLGRPPQGGPIVSSVCQPVQSGAMIGIMSSGN